MGELREFGKRKGHCDVPLVWEENQKRGNKSLKNHCGSVNPSESERRIKSTASLELSLLAKIGDWGSAKALALSSETQRAATHTYGTVCWLAPEVMKHSNAYSEKSDVYSFGIILWELATREEVYQGLEATQIIARVANDNLRPAPIPKACPWKDLMVRCWNKNPEVRPNFKTIADELTRIFSKCKESRRPSVSACFLTDHHPL